MQRHAKLDGTHPNDRHPGDGSLALQLPNGSGRVLVSLAVALLMVVPAAAWLAASPPGMGSLPKAAPRGGLALSASHPGNGSGNNSTTYCWGGHASHASNGSQSFESCFWVFSTSPYYAVSFYSNSTNGSGPYTFAFQFGDGYVWNTSGPSNISGTVTHYYPSSGNYTVRASVVDSRTVLGTTSTISVNSSANSTGSPLSVVLSYTETPIHGSPASLIGFSVLGGLPLTNTIGIPSFDVRIGFGDGSSFGGRNSSQGEPGTVTHTYSRVANQTSYTVSAMVWDAKGSAANATFNVTPTYNFGSNSSGNNSTRGSQVTVLLSNSHVTDVFVSAWNSSFRVSAVAQLTAGNHSAMLSVGNGTIGGGASPERVLVLFGDGSSWNSSFALNGSNGSFATNHTYVAPGVDNLTVRATDATGQVIQVVAPLTVHFLGASGNGSGNNSSAGSNATVLLSSPNVTVVALSAWNGTFRLGAIAQLTAGNSSNASVLVLRNGTVSGGAPPVLVVVQFGDNTNWNTTLPHNQSNGSFVTSHAYAAPGRVTLTLLGFDSSGARLTVSVGLSIHVAGSNASGAGTTWLNQTGPNGTTSVTIDTWNGSLRVGITATLTPLNASAQLGLAGTIAFTTGPAYLVFGFDRHRSSSLAFNASGGFAAGWTYNHTGLSWLTLNATDGNGTTLYVATLLNVTFLPGGPSSPAHVSVTVGAAPVTGTAPLNTTLSAFLFGGQPPFAVSWSLPGSNWTTNATGLMVDASYANPGWYPVTAFVYNTSNPFGTVLVGVGGVWLYVSGSNSSGNDTDGNGTPNGSGDTPIGGGNVRTSGTLGAMTTAGLLAVVVAGAAFGGLGGFLAGRGTARPRRNSAPVSAAKDPPPTRRG
jgi:hypothetical protein